MTEDRMLSDEILLGLINKNSGGGGGGTTNYNNLDNLPQIGGVTLQGNMTASDLGLATETALADKADKSAIKNEFIGTLDEWNALTVEQRKAYDTYQIKGDYTEGSGGLPDYSTTEQKTGQKWVDGKDVYCIVFANIGSVSLNANDWTNIVELNAAEMIKITVITTDNTTNDGRLRWNYSNGYIRGAANSNISYNIAYIIVEYTKTA